MADTVGQQLKAAREARKLSLEQVYQSTRINVRYLHALEEDIHQALPSPVQARGFLRLYAGFLNLPVQALVDLWDGNTLPDAIIEMVEEPEPDDEPDLVATTIKPLEPEAPEDDLVPIIIAADDRESAGEIEASIVAPSEQIFQELGQQLRERREALGLSLVDVEHYTRLRQHYLTALEQGRMNDLPSLVQGRGMLYNYATFLELDSEALLLRFAEALQERRMEMMPVAPAANPLKKDRPTQPRLTSPFKRVLTPDLLIGGGVIIVILLFAIWGASRVSALRNQQTARTEAPLANILLFTTTPPAPGDTGEPSPQAITVAPNSEIGNLPPANPEGEVTPTALPVLDDAPLQVYVSAQDRAWLRVLEDGKEAFTGRVVAGNVYQFSADEQIELVTGNAAALQVFFNQQELGTLGLHGQVASLIFNLEGIVTPTPSFTETPTPTQAPSVTPLPTETPRATPSVTPFIP